MWQSKEEQVAAVLRGLIASGEWPDGRLPGYRTLERRLEAGRETIEKALSRLTTEGLLSPAQRGKRRQILNRGAKSAALERRTLLTIGPRPIHECSPGQRMLLTATFQKAESRGWRVLYHHLDFEFPRRVVTAMKRAVTDHNPERVLMITPPAALKRWAQDAEIPCYRIGGTGGMTENQLPGVGVSFSALVCAAAGLLWDRGHRRLLIPIVSGRDAMRQAALDMSAQSWARDVPRVELEAMFPWQGEWLPDVLGGFWPKQFAQLKPTAVIVKDGNEFLSLISYCKRRNIHIPDDLSVVQLSGDPSSVWLDPQPDRFEFPVEAMCQKVMHWLEQPSAKGGTFELMDATYHRGGTVAAIPNGA